MPDDMTAATVISSGRISIAGASKASSIEAISAATGIFLHHESNEKTETAKFDSHGSHFPRFLFFCKRL